MFASETAFEQTAAASLQQLADLLDDADARGDLEAELRGGILTVAVAGKQFIINKHGPSQQIWVSSPISGGLHFAYNAEAQNWQLPDGRELFSLLTHELQTLAGITLK
jgi:frataxin